MAIRRIITCSLAILGVLVANACIIVIAASEKNEIVLLGAAIFLVIVDMPLLRAIRGKAVRKSG
jgi:hypothetical protein